MLAHWVYYVPRPPPVRQFAIQRVWNPLSRGVYVQVASGAVGEEYGVGVEPAVLCKLDGEGAEYVEEHRRAG